MRNNIIGKKGISDIVGVTMIVLLTIVALSVMWSYVGGITENIESLSPVPDCLQLRWDVNACHNDLVKKAEVTITSRDRIDALTFIKSEAQASTRFTCNSAENSAQCIPGQCIPGFTGGNTISKTFYVPEESPGKVIVYANACQQFAKEVDTSRLC